MRDSGPACTTAGPRKLAWSSGGGWPATTSITRSSDAVIGATTTGGPARTIEAERPDDSVAAGGLREVVVDHRRQDRDSALVGDAAGPHRHPVGVRVRPLNRGSNPAEPFAIGGTRA